MVENIEGFLPNNMLPIPKSFVKGTQKQGSVVVVYYGNRLRSTQGVFISNYTVTPASLELPNYYLTLAMNSDRFTHIMSFNVMTYKYIYIYSFRIQIG